MECKRYNISDFWWSKFAVSKKQEDVIGTGKEMILECLECEYKDNCEVIDEIVELLNK
jgi:hypothetical protein